MNAESVIHLLDYVRFGACVTDSLGNVLFWNSGAEQVLGYHSHEVVGLTCPDLISGIAEEPSLLLEHKNQQFRRIAEGYFPDPFNWRLRDSAGGTRLFQVTPVVLPGLSQRGSLVVYLFGEFPVLLNGLAAGQVQGGELKDAATPFGRVGFLNGHESVSGAIPSPRELEVLRLVSRGMDVAGIAGELHLSVHTVLNHIRNARRKLEARTRMDAVLTAMRRGLL